MSNEKSYHEIRVHMPQKDMKTLSKVYKLYIKIIQVYLMELLNDIAEEIKKFNADSLDFYKMKVYDIRASSNNHVHQWITDHSDLYTNFQHLESLHPEYFTYLSKTVIRYMCLSIHSSILDMLATKKFQSELYQNIRRIGKYSLTVYKAMVEKKRFIPYSIPICMSFEIEQQIQIEHRIKIPKFGNYDVSADDVDMIPIDREIDRCNLFVREHHSKFYAYILLRTIPRAGLDDEGFIKIIKKGV